MKTIDRTGEVMIGTVDDESSYVEKCICGKKFPAWNFMISIYDDSASECPECGRKYYFRYSVRVFEVVEE